MNVIKKVVSVGVCVATVLWTISSAYITSEEAQEDKNTKADHNSVIIWYTDETLTDYLNYAAVEYNEMYGVRVLPKLHPADEYLENINETTLSGGEYPDLYIISNDMLEKAYLSGLASQIHDENNEISDANFPSAAINAVEYKDKMIAYPFYFETSAMVYNKTYLLEYAKNMIMAEEGTEAEAADAQKAENGEEVTADGANDAELEQKARARMEEMLPDNFDELMAFANEYDAPQDVEAIFKWDVKDIFYNYFFIGDYIDVGGVNGDNQDKIDIYSEDSIRAMQVYQNMNQFFSFEYENISYASVSDEFMEGKVVFTTATTDIVNRLDTATKNGEFPYEYGIIQMPKLNENLTTRNLSVTNCIVVNGYSSKRSDANDVAKYISLNLANELYARSGKLSSNKNVSYEDENVNAFVSEYARSRAIPKMMATANFWMQFEMTFSKIWSGGAVSDNMKQLSEQMHYQVTGEYVAEKYIEVNLESEEIEYYDEAAEIEAAQNEE